MPKATPRPLPGGRFDAWYQALDPTSLHGRREFRLRAHSMWVSEQSPQFKGFFSSFWVTMTYPMHRSESLRGAHRDGTPEQLDVILSISLLHRKTASVYYIFPVLWVFWKITKGIFLLCTYSFMWICMWVFEYVQACTPVCVDARDLLKCHSSGAILLVFWNRVSHGDLRVRLLASRPRWPLLPPLP